MDLVSAINSSALYASRAEKDSLGRTITATYLSAIPTALNVNTISARDGLSANNVDVLTAISTMSASIANFGSFQIVPLANDVPDVQSPDTKIFYLTKPSTATETDPYTEWIYTDNQGTTAWNVIGLTKIDLNGYAKMPSSFTANHIPLFSNSTDVLQDSTYTINDIPGSISGITLNGGSEISIVNKVVDLPNATTTSAGLMSSGDKTKLNGIESGANVNVQADWNESDSATDAYIANKPDIIIPLSSNAFPKATNIMVVSAMPSSPDPTTIYFVKEAT